MYDLVIFLIILFAIFLFSFVVLYLRYEVIKEEKKLRRAIELNPMFKLSVQISISFFSFLSQHSSFYFKAEMYFSDRMLILIPKSPFVLHRNSLRLPIIITDNVNDVYSEIRFRNTVKPKHLNISTPFILSIKYFEENKFMNSGYLIEVSPLLKDEYKTFWRIAEMKFYKSMRPISLNF